MSTQYAVRWLWIPLAALGCGHSKHGGPTGTGASETETVTAAEGGEITVDGTTLSVPAGALPADTEITVTSTTSNPPSQFTTWSSPVFKFDPDGLVFLMPVQVTLDFTGSPTNPVVMWSNASGGYDNLGGSVSGNRITTSVIHFSQGFVVPASILPDGGQGTPTDSSIHPPGGDGGTSGGDGGTSGGDGGSHPPGDGGITPPGDGGSTGGDGGTINHDGGGFMPDGGSSGADGGFSSDGGSSGADGGTIKPDGGFGADGGTSGADGGFIHADGGAPPPPSDGGTPPPPSDGGK